MESVTLLGTAAAALQLMEYGKGIIVFISRTYKNATFFPQHYREYEAQLNLLIHIADIIAVSEQLHSNYVKLYLESLEVEVRALQRILCQPLPENWKSLRSKRLWSLIAGTEQKEIDEHLNRLDKANSQLSLYIQIVISNKISNNGSVEKSSNNKMDMAERQYAYAVRARAANVSHDAKVTQRRG